MGLSSETVTVMVNGVTTPTNISGQFSGVDFNQFDGPLYIGGHPDLSMIQVGGVRVLY